MILCEVYIDMDQAIRWWACQPSTHTQQPVNKIQLSEDQLEHYRKVSAEYQEMQEQLEHLYRHQEGLSPFRGSPFYKEDENVKTQP